MKFSKTTLETYERNLQSKKDAAERPLTKQYLNPNEIEIGSEVTFALLDEDPLEYWEVWGQNIETNKYRPFRFPGEGPEPSNEDIHSELGGNWVRQKTDFENLARGINGIPSLYGIFLKNVYRFYQLSNLVLLKQ